jgi:peptidoglycan/LPS O-acetylase OafA/YrhL
MTETLNPPVWAPAVVAPTVRSSPKREFRADIQGLRAVAVLLVVLYHCGVPGFTGGYVGVDVFFVISGFLITGHLVREVESKGRIRFTTFYANRIRRLLPLSAVVVLGTLLLARVWSSVFLVKSITTDAVYTAFYALNYRLADQAIDYQQASAPPSPLQHFWSLAVEEQFYFAWPIVIMVCVWIGGRYRWQLLGAVLSAIAAWSLWQSITITRANAPLAYFSLQTRAWELCAGAALAMLAARLPRLPKVLAGIMSWTGLAMVVGTALRFDDRTAFPGTLAMLPVAGAALLLASGFRPTPWSVRKYLELRPAQWVGKLSYAWYLWHWPLLVLLPRAFTTEVTWFQRLEISAVALFLAAVSHFLIEAPALRTHLHKPRWFTTGVALQGATAAVALVIASSVPAFAGSGAATSAVAFNPADPSSIQAQLVDGLQIADAPRNLTPSLLDAPADLPEAGFDNGCHADYLTVKQPACVFGEPTATKTLVLMGDSHAQQWMPALDVAAKQAGWRMVSWTKAACSVADVSLIEAKIGRNYWECDEWRRQTIDNIISLQPDLLVISQSDSVPGDQFTNTEWADATGKTLSTFQQAGVPVVFMLDTPQPALDIPECLAEHLGDVGACNSVGHLSDYEGRRDDVQSVLSTIGITVIDPVDWFCVGRSQCPAIVGNLLVYRDLTHMTRAYSEHLAPMIVPLLNRHR